MNWLWFHVPVSSKFVKLAFLTNLNHFLHIILFFLSSLQSARLIVSLIKNKPSQDGTTLADVLFGFTLTLSSVIGLSVCGLFLYDERMIFPPDLERIYPRTLNLYQHVGIVVLVWVELGLWRHRYLAHFRHELIIILFASIFYIAIQFTYFILVGQHVYPFMHSLAPSGFLLFYVFTTSLTVAIHWIGKNINKALWGRIGLQSHEMKLA